MIYLIDYFDTSNRHQNHFVRLYDHLIQDGFDVQLLGILNEYKSLATPGLIGDVYAKTMQYAGLHELILQDGISDGDVFIFTDAWNVNAINLKYILTLSGIDVKLIGLWRDGIFDINSKIRYAMLKRPKYWTSAFERLLYNIYDYNCYITEQQRDRFLSTYRLKSGAEKTRVTGLPFGDIKPVSATDKQNMAVVAGVMTPEQRDMVKGLRNEFEDYEFIDVNEYRLGTDEYKQLLQRSKIFISFNISETDPTLVYEAMGYGCIPIIPAHAVYLDVYPDVYHYNPKTVCPPFLNFVRGRDELHGKVGEFMENYDTYSRAVDIDRQRIGERYFDPKRLIDVLKL